VDPPSYYVILGFDWLYTSNPTINFKNKKLKFMSNCHIENCLSFLNTYTTTPELINNDETDEVSRMSDEKILKIFQATLQSFKNVIDEKAANKFRPHIL